VASPDYYQALEIESTALAEDIRRAYRRLVRVHHPDLNPGDPQAVDRTRLINEAYAVLRDPSLRTSYDEARIARDYGGHAGDASDRHASDRGAGNGARTRVRTDTFQDDDQGWTFGTSGWTVCVGEERTEAAARMLVGIARREGIRVTTLATSDHPNLIPGRWMVFSGHFESRGLAQRAARHVARKIGGARHVYVMAE
jgi:curved DNA-binding protein CbpA